MMGVPSFYYYYYLFAAGSALCGLTFPILPEAFESFLMSTYLRQDYVDYRCSSSIDRFNPLHATDPLLSPRDEAELFAWPHERDVFSFSLL